MGGNKLKILDIFRYREGQLIGRCQSNFRFIKAGKGLRPSVSSSVMDYLQLHDEHNVEHDWEAYDKAAIVYAYSGGEIDLNKVDYVDGKPVKRDVPHW